MLILEIYPGNMSNLYISKIVKWLNPRMVKSCNVQREISSWDKNPDESIYTVTYRGFYSRWNFIALQKVSTLQLNTVGNASNTRTRPTCTVSEH
jgi:hypothetical protein